MNACSVLGGIALLATLAATGCTTPRTEVIVVVDTDLSSGPGAVETLRVTVTGPDGTMQSSTAALGPTEPPLPRTLGLLHSGTRYGPYRVRAEGLVSGVPRLIREAVFSFVPRETRMLRLDLLRSCLTTVCRPAETCGEGGCRPVEVSEAELIPWTGIPPGLDGGGGADAPRLDAPRLDAPRPDTPGDAPVIPPDVPPDAPDVPDAPPCADGDGDTFFAGPGCVAPIDCDDSAPAVFPGATETCNGADDDCDMMMDEGFDLMTDDANCGRCGRACDFRNATGSACRAGICEIGACNAGFDDCNMDGVDGCEITLATDPMHCGRCGMACGPPTRMCCMSVCAVMCP